MTENELAEKNAQFAKGVMELAFRMGYVTRDDELIRCKDCKYYGGEIKGCNHDDAMIIATADDFCSLAERKEE